MRGHEVNFVCADDAHGAPIMIAAEKAGKTPQQFVATLPPAASPISTAFISALTTGTPPMAPKTTRWRRTDLPRCSRQA
jgi:hypothetical protein